MYNLFKRKTKMKKIIAIAAVLIVVVLMVGCSASANTSKYLDYIKTGNTAAAEEMLNPYHNAVTVDKAVAPYVVLDYKIMSEISSQCLDPSDGTTLNLSDVKALVSFQSKGNGITSHIVTFHYVLLQGTGWQMSSIDDETDL